MSKVAVVYWSSTGNTESMANAVADGAKAAGAEVSVFETADFDAKLSGKKTGLFGSYGWGDGEWMHNWEDKCREDGALLVSDGVICQEEPDDEAVEKCKELGKALA